MSTFILFPVRLMSLSLLLVSFTPFHAQAGPVDFLARMFQNERVVESLVGPLMGRTVVQASRPTEAIFSRLNALALARALELAEGDVFTSETLSRFALQLGGRRRGHLIRPLKKLLADARFSETVLQAMGHSYQGEELVRATSGLAAYREMLWGDTSLQWFRQMAPRVLRTLSMAQPSATEAEQLRAIRSVLASRLRIRHGLTRVLAPSVPSRRSAFLLRRAPELRHLGGELNDFLGFNAWRSATPRFRSQRTLQSPWVETNYGFIRVAAPEGELGLRSIWTVKLRLGRRGSGIDPELRSREFFGSQLRRLISIVRHRQLLGEPHRAIYSTFEFDRSLNTFVFEIFPSEGGHELIRALVRYSRWL